MIGTQTSNALTGTLELTVSPTQLGRSSVTRQYHSVPFHVSKPYWDGHVLMVQVVNPTAGIFQGDRMECRVRVEKDGSLLLTSPSAARAHTMDGNGEIPVLRQNFQVAKGAWLEVFPELFIPQRASRYRQRTEIEMEEGGSLYFVETLAPGRVAHGESFAYRHLDWSFALRSGNRLIALERALVEPPDRSSMLEVDNWERAYYGCVWMVGPALENLSGTLVDAVHSLTEPQNCLVGMSRVSSHCCVVKILASSSISLRRCLMAVRQNFRAVFPQLESSMRKL